MLRQCSGAGLVLLLVMGVAVAANQDDGKKKKGGQRDPNAVFGKVVSLELKDGVGTLTVLGRQGRGGEEKEVKFQVNKDTKFVKGGGRGAEPAPVEADKVAETFKKDTRVMVRSQGEDDKRTATTVSVFGGGGRRRPNNK